MSTSVKLAAMQHTLDVARLYLQNAVLGRAIPDKPARITVGDDPAAVPDEPAAPQPAGPTTVVQVAPAAAATPSWIKTAALVAGIGLPAAAAGAGIMNWLSRPAVSAVGGTAAVKPAATVLSQESLLQYLEDNAYHLPSDKRGTR